MKLFEFCFHLRWRRRCKMYRETLNSDIIPPQGDTIFEKHLQDLLLRHDVCTKEVRITRDFNINLLDFENSKKVQSFVNLMLRCGMVPVIFKRTRVATVIDHMFTNTIINTEIKSGIIKTHISAIWKSWHWYRHRHSNINIVFYTELKAFRIKS